MLMFDIESSFQRAHLFMSFLNNGPIFLLAFVVMEGVINETIELSSYFFAGTVDAHDCVFDVAEEGLGVLFCGHVGLLCDVIMYVD